MDVGLKLKQLLRKEKISAYRLGQDNKKLRTESIEISTQIITEGF